ncbi:ArpU family phage packaging/lysis transcriptional regulator [Fructilactobacillus florum]|uniref:ArpU family phage packaging/lysis transcriptional regulator n=1 Tax=Fructilactobacillus florum TaxID=640331 RepID=UPI00138F940E|nr:ArpU family phage packaging/lysis transcriptional regulator [Fructilactobacillus florum]
MVKGRKEIEDAKKILERYQEAHLVELANKVGISSPSFDDQPKSGGFENSQEDKLVNSMERSQAETCFCKRVRMTISLIHDEINADSASILKLIYMYGKTNDEVMETLRLSKSHYYRQKNDALLIFKKMFGNFNIGDMGQKWD